jgi:hypothetical protein
MTLLTNDPADDGWPQWSPDGKRIVFTSVRDDCSFSDNEGCEEINDIGEFHTLYVMNADGTGQTRITDEPYAQFATWSPDGKYIMFTPALLRRLRRQRRIARRRPPLARGNRAGSGPGLRRPRCLTSAPISSSNWPTCCELPISSAPRGKPSMKLPGCMKERGTSLPLGA